MSFFLLPAIRRSAGALLLGSAVFTIAITGRLLIDSRRHLDEALRFEGAGDRAAAVSAFESAIKAYVPGSPYPARALRELAILAKGAEMRGDAVRAAAIWEVGRRSILATRHFYQPFGDQLGLAERELVRLRQAQASHRDVAANPIARPADPSPVFSLLLFAGLLCWAGGSLALCFYPNPQRAVDRRMRYGIWLACLGGLGLWLLMAWLAG